MRAAGLENFVSFIKGLPWKLIDRSHDPLLRARINATFDALIQIGAVDWRPKSELPIGEYDRVELREDDWSRFSALLPKHAPGLADTFYVLRERDNGVSHVAGPYPINKLNPASDVPAPFSPQVSMGFAFAGDFALASEPSGLGIFAGKSPFPGFGALLGATGSARAAR